MSKILADVDEDENLDLDAPRDTFVAAVPWHTLKESCCACHGQSGVVGVDGGGDFCVCFCGRVPCAVAAGAAAGVLLRFADEVKGEGLENAVLSNAELRRVSLSRVRCGCLCACGWEGTPTARGGLTDGHAVEVVPGNTVSIEDGGAEVCVSQPAFSAAHVDSGATGFEAVLAVAPGAVRDLLDALLASLWPSVASAAAASASMASASDFASAPSAGSRQRLSPSTGLGAAGSACAAARPAPDGRGDRLCFDDAPTMCLAWGTRS